MIGNEKICHLNIEPGLKNWEPALKRFKLKNCFLVKQTQKASRLLCSKSLANAEHSGNNYRLFFKNEHVTLQNNIHEIAIPD